MVKRFDSRDGTRRPAAGRTSSAWRRIGRVCRDLYPVWHLLNPTLLIPGLLLAVGLVAAFGQPDVIGLAAAFDWLWFVLQMSVLLLLALGALLWLGWRLRTAPGFVPHGASRAARADVVVVRRPTPPPSPYPGRLARYLGIDEADIRGPGQRGQSRMPFWLMFTSMAPGRRLTPEAIRYLLERIRRGVRAQDDVA